MLYHVPISYTRIILRFHAKKIMVFSDDVRNYLYADAFEHYRSIMCSWQHDVCPSTTSCYPNWINDMIQQLVVSFLIYTLNDFIIFFFTINCESIDALHIVTKETFPNFNFFSFSIRTINLENHALILYIVQGQWNFSKDGLKLPLCNSNF